MPQEIKKAPKEQIPNLLIELNNRLANVQNISLAKEFLDTVTVTGARAVDLGRCITFMDNMVKGENGRITQIRAMLPDEDAVIDLTKPEAPVGPEEPAETEPQGSDVKPEPQPA